VVKIFNLKEQTFLCKAAIIVKLQEHLQQKNGGENFGIGDGRVVSRPQTYLDSQILHRYLKLFSADILGVVDSNTIPIFLFNLQGIPLLLDRNQQAVWFHDMVIAAQTPEEQWWQPLDYICGEEIINLDTSDATRSTFAAILQTVFAISPTSERWDFIHNRVVEDHLWSVGNTPFGTFSDTISLSFSQRDSAVRNVLESKIHTILVEVDNLFNHFSDYNKEVSEVLSTSDHLQFIRRWNLLQYKLEEARNFLSLHKYNSSFRFVNSLHHDVAALHKLIHLAGSHLHTYFHCEKSDPSIGFPYLTVVVAASPFIVIAAIITSQAKTMMSKKANKKIKLRN